MTQHGHVETFHVIAVSSDAGCRNPGLIEESCRIERTDGDVISVRIQERELHGASVWIHMRLFFQPADQRAPPRQSHLEVVDPEEQEEAVARLGVAGTCQRGMLVGTPLVETKQDRSIRVDDLPEVVVGRSRLRRPSSDWYHLKLWGTSATPIIVHVRFIGSSAANQSLIDS